MIYFNINRTQVLSCFFPVSKSGNWIAQAALGFGFGNGHCGNYDDSYDFYAYDFSGMSVTPAFGYCRKRFEIVLSTKFTRANYTNITESSAYGNDAPTYSLEANNQQLFYEPQLSIRLGLKNIRWLYQIGLAHSFTDKYFPTDHIRFSIGLNYSFQLLK